MSYKNYLHQKISELQHEISEDRGEIEVLKKELKKLQLAEFEDAHPHLHEQNYEKQLLKG